MEYRPVTPWHAKVARKRGCSPHTVRDRLQKVRAQAIEMIGDMAECGQMDLVGDWLADFEAAAVVVSVLESRRTILAADSEADADEDVKGDRCLESRDVADLRAWVTSKRKAIAAETRSLRFLESELDKAEGRS